MMIVCAIASFVLGWLVCAAMVGARLTQIEAFIDSWLEELEEEAKKHNEEMKKKGIGV